MRNAFETVKGIYQASGSAKNCTLIETPKAHWWCVDIVWNAIKKEVVKLGWEL